MHAPNRPAPELADQGRGGGPVSVLRPGMVRRTTSIDMHWPEGRGGAARFDARSRDAFVAADGALRIMDAHAITGQASLARQISGVDAGPDVRIGPALEGLRAGGQVRARLRELFPHDADRQGGLYLLLDDLAGATLVGNWGWFAWDGYSEALGNIIRGADISGWNGSMRGVCMGLREGSSALDAKGFPKMEEQYSATVAPLVHPDDVLGWHDLPAFPEAAMRRARWIDVWRDGPVLHVATGFQDSGARPDGQRQAIHEYRARLVLEADFRIAAIDVTPHLLPHGDCPAAILNVTRVKGERLDNLREIVPQRLAGEDGCTHLNDVLRALCGVPSLAHHLPA